MKIALPIKIIITIIITLVACFFLYSFIDQNLNGLILNWVSNNFVYTYTSNSYEGGAEITNEQLNWGAIKSAFLITFIAIALLVSFLIVTISHFYAKRNMQKVVSENAKLIHQFMEDDFNHNLSFPKAYSEIETQLVQIKAKMQRHEQIIQDESKRKNDLITYLAHDLKTPLTSIIGYLSLLEEAADMPIEQKAKYTKITLDKANRLEKLINEFFEITRYNLQQMILEKESIDLYYMLLQMTDEFYPILQEHKNTTTLNIDENLVVLGDSIKLARVFNNILKNAIAYSYPNTVIEISAKIENDFVCISFSNQGKTIAKEHLSALFDKFFRLDEARSTNTGGAGLGLAIAKEIVNLHGGSISATSENEQTIFILYLPL